MNALMTPEEHARARCAVANVALVGMTDRQRIAFGLSLILDVKAPNEASRLRFAANRISESCDILLREVSDRKGL